MDPPRQTLKLAPAQVEFFQRSDFADGARQGAQWIGAQIEMREVCHAAHRLRQLRD